MKPRDKCEEWIAERLRRALAVRCNDVLCDFCRLEYEPAVARLVRAHRRRCARRVKKGA